MQIKGGNKQAFLPLLFHSYTKKDGLGASQQVIGTKYLHVGSEHQDKLNWNEY